MALNIADLFEHAADAVPERLAIACGDAEITYAELEARSNQLAHFLAAAGVGEGDHVGIYGRNSIELIEAFFACYKLRAIAVNINYRYVEAELRYLFTEAELVALVHDRQFSDKVAALLPDYPGHPGRAGDRGCQRRSPGGQRRLRHRDRRALGRA